MTDAWSDPPPRTTDLALARVHLRLGSLALARAELESLAGRDELDADGVLDLAEVRWRTGDLTGAGEAAALCLDADDDGPLVARVIAAEAALHAGRPTEARRLAGLAMADGSGAIDALFAGMPRGPVWPPDATDVPASMPTLFDAPIAGSAMLGASAGDGPAGTADGASSAPGGEAPAAGADPTIEIWASIDALGPPTPDVEAPGSVEPPAEASVETPDAGDAALPSGDVALARGIDALTADDPAEAAVQLAIALRLSPALAPAVLAAIGDRPGRGLALVRGDAYRLVGREVDARRAFAAAAAAPDPPPIDPFDADPDPATQPTDEGDPP